MECDTLAERSGLPFARAPQRSHAHPPFVHTLEKECRTDAIFRTGCPDDERITPDDQTCAEVVAFRAATRSMQHLHALPGGAAAASEYVTGTWCVVFAAPDEELA